MVALFSPTFFDSSKTWHNESFLQKTDNYILVKPKSLPQKNYRVANFSIFHDFSIILSLITQSVFVAKTCAWVRWKGYLLSKIQKIKKTNNNNFFQNFFWF
jgi:hypothetical protein